MTQFKDPSILITGATGSVGTHLIKYLSEKNVSFRVLARKSDRATKLSSIKGLELVYGDLADKNSVKNALQGIEKVFLLTNSSETAETLQLNFVDAAKANGVRHIVKLSQLAATLHSPVRFLRYHAAVEQKIKELAMSYTFLRPNLFMQGLLGFKESIIKKGMFFAAVGEAKISLVDVRDIAAVAAETLTTEGHDNKIYDITGPEAITHRQIADHFSQELKKAVKFIDVKPEDMHREVVKAGFPLWQADGLMEDYAHYARGEAAHVSSNVKNITGNSPRNFQTFIADYAPFFQ
jgi:uncharacterized protein YbjT (DUF2867 family)